VVPHDIENNAGKARQTEIADKYVNVTEAIREHHAKNRLNSARRPKVAAVRIDLFAAAAAAPIRYEVRIVRYPAERLKGLCQEGWTSYGGAESGGRPN
jgi:hypothetical protein